MNERPINNLLGEVTREASSLLEERWCLSPNFFLKNYGVYYELFNIKTGEHYKISSTLSQFLERCNGINPLHRALSYINTDNREHLEHEINKLITKGILEHYRRMDLAPIRYTGPLLKRLMIHLSCDCNLQCIHCYQNAPTNVKLSVSIIEKIIKSAARLNLFNLSLTGGEPFLDTDLITFLEEASIAHGFRIENIFTNGTLLSQHYDCVKRLHKQFNTAFYVSVDSIGKSFDIFRGKRGAFASLKEGLDTLASIGANLTANITLTKRTAQTMPDTLQFLNNYPNFQRCRFNPPFQMGRWTLQNDEMLSIEEEFESLKACIAIWERHQRRYEIEFGRFFRYLYGRIYRFSEYSYDKDSLCCDYYKDVAVILANGDVVPCVLLRDDFTCGNLREHELFDIWNNPKMREIKNLKINALNIAKCNECKFLIKCGTGCRGDAILLGNGPCGIDEVTCSFFHSGLIDKIETFIDSI